eukprot:4158638-Prymnesium_polylepis.1
MSHHVLAWYVHTCLSARRSFWSRRKCTSQPVGTLKSGVYRRSRQHAATPSSTLRVACYTATRAPCFSQQPPKWTVGWLASGTNQLSICIRYKAPQDGPLFARRAAADGHGS